MKKQPPDLSRIISAAAQHFQIAEDSLLTPGRGDDVHDLGRNAVIFIAIKAGHENKQISDKLGLSNTTLTERFKKLSGAYTRGASEQAVEFIDHVDKIARDLNFSLVG